MNPALLNPALPASVIRVLLVDDHAVLRQGLRSIVTSYEQLRVIGEARDGVEAVALAHQLSPDVVIMDINMPKMDGIEATRQIKRERPDIIVIGLSVNQSPDTECRMKAAGATALLGKESAAETLCEMITEAVFHHRNTSARQAG
jgi:DNA-binding NarL/FixJ family response regulator